MRIGIHPAQPTPWKVHHDEDVSIIAADGMKICVNVFDLETAELLVKAVNAKARGDKSILI